jgi:hypothetical protein
MENMAHALKKTVQLDGAEAVQMYLQQEGTTHAHMDAGNTVAETAYRDAGHAAPTSNPPSPLEADAAGTSTALPDEPGAPGEAGGCTPVPRVLDGVRHRDPVA